MPCDQKPLLRRLVVEESPALREPRWQAHLRACAECRYERLAYERSLAVFQQFEAQRLAAAPPSPGWGPLARRLARHERLHQRHRRLQLPIAAAMAVAVAAGGVVAWEEWRRQEPQPAKIVRMEPAQESRMQQVLRESLEEPRRVARPVNRDRAATPTTPASTGVSLYSARSPILARPRRPVSSGETRAPVILFRSLQQMRSLQVEVEVSVRRGAGRTRAPLYVTPHPNGTQAFAPQPIR